MNGKSKTFYIPSIKQPNEVCVKVTINVFTVEHNPLNMSLNIKQHKTKAHIAGSKSGSKSITQASDRVDKT